MKKSAPWSFRCPPSALCAWPRAAGIGGTGGVFTALPSLFVTPGMKAIGIMFDALLNTVDAIEWTV